MRLDKYLVEQGYFESRNRALEAIKSNKVTVNGKLAKASQKITDASEIEVISSKFYVSRAAKKLESFLTAYPISMVDKIALDIGSSTGGFAQILLEHDIQSIDCVDVGTNQLHHSLLSHPNLTLHEETDIRLFKSDKKFTLITCDVSFISVLQIIADIDTLASSECDIVILYKPQFEVGRLAKRDSRGVVIDADATQKCRNEFESQAKSLGWIQRHQALSKVAGKEGNQEYLYHFLK